MAPAAILPVPGTGTGPVDPVVEFRDALRDLVVAPTPRDRDFAEQRLGELVEKARDRARTGLDTRRRFRDQLTPIVQCYRRIGNCSDEVLNKVEQICRTA